MLGVVKLRALLGDANGVVTVAFVQVLRQLQLEEIGPAELEELEVAALLEDELATEEAALLAAELELLFTEDDAALEALLLADDAVLDALLVAEEELELAAEGL